MLIELLDEMRMPRSFENLMLVRALYEEATFLYGSSKYMIDEDYYCHQRFKKDYVRLNLLSVDEILLECGV